MWWPFQKKKRGPFCTVCGTPISGHAGTCEKCEASQVPRSPKDKLIASGMISRFVNQQGGSWDHRQWLIFLSSVRSAGHDTLSDAEIGSLLEAEKLRVAAASKVAPLIRTLLGDSWKKEKELKEAATALEGLGDEATEPLLAAVLNCTWDVSPSHAMEVLARTNGARALEALPSLLSALKHPKRWPRSHAIDCLRYLPSDDRAVQAILTAAIEEIEDDNSYHAAQVFGSLSDNPILDAGSLESFLAQLRTAAQERRVRILRVLESIARGQRDRRLVEPLLGLLYDGNPRVVWWAVTALGNLGAPASVAPLVELGVTSCRRLGVSNGGEPLSNRQHDPEWPGNSVEAVAVALRQLDAKLNECASLEPLVRTALELMSKTSARDFREFYARRLAEIGHPMAVPALKALLDRGELGCPPNSDVERFVKKHPEMVGPSERVTCYMCSANKSITETRAYGDKRFCTTTCWPKRGRVLETGKGQGCPFFSEGMCDAGDGDAICSLPPTQVHYAGCHVFRLYRPRG